ncbi:hypothetical protein CC78DRAFT_586490 [Lojkania enalia]|uniref:Uncharacterized protein n=1 Tax=Lojkania enalia TaxID=147567 RepID=A0A9P4K2K5_9PLEO|nr:hypothetical protein CC78DRAFT_586490 [Didymosphaeria enalia]
MEPKQHPLASVQWSRKPTFHLAGRTSLLLHPPPRIYHDLTCPQTPILKGTQAGRGEPSRDKPLGTTCSFAAPGDNGDAFAGAVATDTMRLPEKVKSDNVMLLWERDTAIGCADIILECAYFITAVLESFDTYRNATKEEEIQTSLECDFA